MPTIIGMAYAPPLLERVLIGDLTESESDCTAASLNSLRPAKYKEWSKERMKLAMQAVLEIIIVFFSNR